MTAPAAPLERARQQGLPTPVMLVAVVFLLLGLFSFAIGLGVDPATTWRSFHVNYLYWGGIAQGGLVLSAIFVIVGATWPGPVRRIAEGLAAWVPVTFVLGLFGFLGRDHLYPWIEEPIAAKQAWLNVPRLVVTDVAILGVLAVLTWMFLRLSVRPTLGEGANLQGPFASFLAKRWTSGWRGAEAERAHTADRLRVLAPIICIVYALGWSVIAFDQVMSLSPTWFSNLFGAYFAWGAFLSAISVTAILAVLHRAYPGFEGHVTTGRLHDLGKMIFAFSIFWMYLFFSQYMIIWYGNLPEETSFFQARLGSEFLQSTRDWQGGWPWERWWISLTTEPWVRVTLFTWVCCWVVPFWFLLGQRPKKTAWFLASVAAVSAFGFWLERNVLIWPSLVPDDSWAFLGIIQIGMALGFLGGFTLVYLAFTRVFPSLAVPEG